MAKVDAKQLTGYNVAMDRFAPSFLPFGAMSLFPESCRQPHIALGSEPI
ncbi:hypothetical protein [Aquamicrobium sp. LC103]|nr:hypothetical protein [Aquamicrobium sp. LC103]